MNTDINLDCHECGFEMFDLILDGDSHIVVGCADCGAKTYIRIEP